MSDIKDRDTEGRELETTNSHLEVQILPPSILSNLSAKPEKTLLLVSPIQNPVEYNPQSSPCPAVLKKDQYLLCPFPDDQFATDVASDDEGNNVVAMIERLFLNVRHRSSYERLTEKAVYKTCKFSIHSTTHMSSKEWLSFRRIKFGLRPFQTLGIFLIPQIEVYIRSKGILVNEMGYGKIRYLIF